MIEIYIRAAIELLKRSDINSAVFILSYILRVIENDAVDTEDIKQAGDILSSLKE